MVVLMLQWHGWMARVVTPGALVLLALQAAAHAERNPVPAGEHPASPAPPAAPPAMAVVAAEVAVGAEEAEGAEEEGPPQQLTPRGLLQMSRLSENHHLVQRVYTKPWE